MMSHVTPEPILQIASSFMAAKHLFVANEVGLFERLADGPADLDELARRTDVPRRTLRMLADAMVAPGFLERHGALYQNGSVAAAFLSGRTPADMRPFLRFWNQLSYPAWTQLEACVREDRAATMPATGPTPEQGRIFAEGVEAITAGPAQALAATYDFGRHRRVLDLGGGTGSFLAAIQRRHADLDTTLFELPSTASIARERLAGDPSTARIQVVAGDFFADPIPPGHDAVIVANVLHLFTAERNLTLLRSIRERVPDGARLLLVDFWTDPTHTQPPFAALMAGEFLLVSGGDSYSAEEAGLWLQESGWRFLDHQPLVGPAGLIIAEATAV